MVAFRRRRWASCAAALALVLAFPAFGFADDPVDPAAQALPPAVADDGATPTLIQQLPIPLASGDIAISGFSGATLATASLPAGVDPLDRTVIDLAGVTLRILDLSTLGGPTVGQVVNAPVKLTVPARDIGQVFALTFDDGAGAAGTGAPNLYAASTSVFGLQIVGDPAADGSPTRLKQGSPRARFMDGQFGSLPGNSPGAIWKIDGATGAVTHIADTAFSGVMNSGPGVGDLAFDRKSRMLYASDLDTGLIHRFDLERNAADLGQFDHGMSGRPGAGLPSVADDGKTADILSADFHSDDPATWGFTQPERRVGALAVRSGRLYYSVADGPEIWSVELNPDGGFGATARRELTVKAAQPFAVTDIVFDDQGRMILAQRGAQKSPFDYVSFADPAAAQTLRYTPAQPGAAATELWTPEPEEYAIGMPDGNRMTVGGLTLTREYNPDGTMGPACERTLVTTGDDLRNNPALAGQIPPGIVNLHGVQLNDASLVRPANVPPTQTAFAAFDPAQADPAARGHVGDVEAVPCVGAAGGDAPAEQGGLDLPPVIGDAVPLPLPEDFGPLNPFPGGGSFSLSKNALTDTCTQDGGCAFGITVFNPGPDPLPGPIQLDDVFTVGGAEQPDAAIIGGPNPPWECTDGAHVTCIHPGPLPVGETVLTLNFKPGPLNGAKEVTNCVALAGELDDDLPPVIEEPKDPVDPVKPDDVKPIAAPLPTETDKNGLLVKTTPVNAGTCSAAKGDCEFKIELINTGQAAIKGPLELTQTVSLGGGNAPAPGPFGPFKVPFGSPSQQLPAGVACKPEAAVVTCSGNQVDIPPGGALTLTLGVSPMLPNGSTAGFVTNSVAAKIGALDGGATASHVFIDAPKAGGDGAKGLVKKGPGQKPGDPNKSNALDDLPPEQCATIAIQDPDDGGGGKVDEQDVNGLTISKTAAAGVVSCKDTDDCKFSIPVKNTTDKPIPGPIEVTETVTGDGALFGATAISSGPTPPWTCVKAGQTFKCTHPGPIAAGASADLNIGFKLGAGSAAKEIKNCAQLQGAAAPVCATVPTAPPPPDPDKKPNLILEKVRDATQCSDAGGGCKFKISVLNRGPGDFEGPLRIEDKLTDEADKLFAGADFEFSPQAKGQDGVVANLGCRKVGATFECTSGPNPVKIPAGKSFEIATSFKLGVGTNAKEIKNCANIEGQPPVCASIPLVNGPLLRAFKVSAASTCVPSCAYGITIVNVGNAPARGPFVLDDVFTPPSSFGGSEVIDGDFACAKGAGGKTVCASAKGPIEPGKAIGFRLLIKGAQIAPEYKNCANIRPENGNGVDAGNPQNCFTIKDPAPLRPNLQIIKTAPNADANGLGSCQLQGFCTFSILIKNTGGVPFVGDVIINDKITDALRLVLKGNEPGWLCQEPINNMKSAVCRFPNANLPIGGTLSLNAGVIPGLKQKNDIFENCATIVIDAVKDTVPEDNSSCARVKLDPFAVQVEKSGGQNCQAGGECAFRIRLFNDGPIPHDAPVTLSDQLDIGNAPITSSDIPSEICATPPTQVPFSCTSPADFPLQIGDQKIFTITVKMPDGAARYTNCAHVADARGGSGGDPGPVVRSGAGAPGATGNESCVSADLAPKDPGSGGSNTSKQPDEPAPTTPPVTTPPVTPPAQCYSNMIADGAGRCACPAGTTFNGRQCARTGGGGVVTPPVVIRCPAGTFGTYPNCSPGSGGTNGTIPQTTPPCPRGTQGVYPNCRVIPVTPTPCPRGTFGTYPNCSPGSGGTNGTIPQTTPPCPRGTRGVYPNCRIIQVTPPPCPRGTVGTYPNCRAVQIDTPRCPPGTTGRYPRCQAVNDGGGGSNGTIPGDDTPPCPPGTTGRYPRCVAIQPPKCPTGTTGTYPNCRPIEIDRRCPPGSIGRYPRCRPIQTPECSSGTTGTYPNCTPIQIDRTCPPGTYGRYPRCRAVQTSCPDGMAGTPPNCTRPQTQDCPAGQRRFRGRCIGDLNPGGGATTQSCPDGYRFNRFARRCIKIGPAQPDTPGPTPTKTCPPGLVLRGGVCQLDVR